MSHQRKGTMGYIDLAGQLVEEGIDLLKMNALLLEKVEELTLYMIRMENANQVVKQQLQVKTKQQLARIDQLEKRMEQLLTRK
ncbi:hypothetical protein [Spirosoma rhododendri]|uniref:Uncharacterized protein n=1 Tax=Spirosoma rhododendri TaxID=2728024 RepID=A0A7L5DN25_9BACT|nr:hypothetical protein [Spirosoma rhododendri]QJD79505.1 hypothetical protein HH216_14635 [Spirosoma rhododendri]